MDARVDILQCFQNAALVIIGDKLGLFRALSQGTMTPAELQRLKAIIIGDVPSTFFTPVQLDTIAALVEQGGSDASA